MKSHTLFPSLLVATVVCASADESLLHTRRAQALLGPEVWSQIIRIENGGRPSQYPRSLHALIFELEGILWFYTPVDGTQSFSLAYGRLEEEKRDFTLLLRDIDPGFGRWRVVGPDEKPRRGRTRRSEREEKLPNGCFIESVVALRALSAGDATLAAPRLLSYYIGGQKRLKGHTVLVCASAESVIVFDPDRPGEVLRFPVALGLEPRKLARALEGSEVDRVRVLPLEQTFGPWNPAFLASMGEAAEPARPAAEADRRAA